MGYPAWGSVKDDRMSFSSRFTTGLRRAGNAGNRAALVTLKQS